MRNALLPLALALALAACAPKAPGAVAELRPTKGNIAAGHMTFVQQGRVVVVKGLFSGLTPGAHGFHIHEKGDCSAPDATSAGGHFNPTGAKHGSPGAASHHLGDLPMLTAGADGSARFEASMDGIAIGEGIGNILGRSVVVHAQPDDFTTQPTGNSGARVACGVIKPR